MDIVPQLVVNSLIASALYALIAMSFNLVFGATKFFNLAHGTLAAVGGYTAYFVAIAFGASLPFALIAGIVVAVIAGYAFERLVFRPLRGKKASNLVLLVASLGIATAVEAGIAMLFTSQFKTLSFLAGSGNTIIIGTASITPVQVGMLATAVLVLVALWLILTRTSFGRAVRAVSDDAEVATIVGIRTDQVIGLVFVIGSAIAGVAGVLAGLDTGIEPRMGFALLLKGVIAAIVGGIGSVYGGFLGALLLGFAENFGIWYINGEWKDAIAFAILIFFLLFRPQGILGKKRA